MLITEPEDIKPLLGTDWLREINWTIRHIEKTTTPTDQSEKDEIITQFKKLFKTNQAIKDNENKKQIKMGHKPIKQKARPIPYHLHNFGGKEIYKLINSGHLKKIQKVDEDCCVSPVIITVKGDKSFEIPLSSGKLNDSCTKMPAHKPNMEEFLSQIPTETTRAPNEPLWISKIDLKYAYDQLKLSEETSKHCKFAITGGNMKGYYRF